MAGNSGNPYNAGAGHSPPHLAGRTKELTEFRDFLKQEVVTKNVILTGLRGVGKTVLMDDKYKPMAFNEGWAWVGSDFSESAFLSEHNVCVRLLTDLSVYSSRLSISNTANGQFGFGATENERQLDFNFLMTTFAAIPGLMADKLKAVLDLVWKCAEKDGCQGIVFAYDEAQLVADQKDKDQYPLALILETFQSIQRKGARYMLLLTGLPTVYPKLVESRTYAERMFTVQEIGRLTERESKEAILVPMKGHDWTFTNDSVELTISTADGYPYFIQFICREAFDYVKMNPEKQSIPIEPIILKLDSNFFGAKWETLTNRQRDMLYCAAQLEHSNEEFTIGDLAASSKTLRVKPFTYNDISQHLPRLIEKGLIYKNRYGQYAFAVPLFGPFIKRKYATMQRQLKFFETGK